MPIGNGYHYQKTAKVQPVCYLSTILALITRKVTFVDNLEQYFESCVLNSQNLCKGALNKVNGLITSKNQVIKIFRGFRVFEQALQQETKTPKSTKGVLNQKILIVNSYHYQETAEKLPIWYLCTILASRTRATPFRLHYNVDVDNFDQCFESCAINIQNTQKSTVNNSVNNLKN